MSLNILLTQQIVQNLKLSNVIWDTVGFGTNKNFKSLYLRHIFIDLSWKTNYLSDWFIRKTLLWTLYPTHRPLCWWSENLMLLPSHGQQSGGQAEPGWTQPVTQGWRKAKTHVFLNQTLSKTRTWPLSIWTPWQVLQWPSSLWKVSGKQRVKFKQFSAGGVK